MVSWCFEPRQSLRITSMAGGRGGKELVSWCFEPSQPLRITSGLEEGEPE